MNGDGDRKQGADGDLPDQNTKPMLHTSAVPDLVLHVYGLKVTAVKQLNGYDDLNFHIKVDSSHSNPHIESICTDGYTLKVLNSAESRRPGVVESQNQIMRKLKKAGFSVPFPTPTLDNAEGSLLRLRKAAGAAWRPIDEADPASEHIVRLLAFVPGQILHSVPYTPTLMFEAGETAARISNCLKEFQHPIQDTNDSMWFLRSVPRSAEYTWVVEDPDRRAMVEDIIRQFSDRVVSQMDQLPKGWLHGDLNEQNLLVSADGSGEYHICGLLDFGDSHRSAQLFELALITMYLMVDCTQVARLDVGGHVLAGYLRHRRLTQLELSLLKTCVCARFAQSLVLGAYAYHQNPTNAYVLVTAKNGWEALRQVWEVPEEDLLKRWQTISQQYQS